MQRPTHDNAGHNTDSGADQVLLAAFLRGLNVTRRKLSLYPANHPQITHSITATLAVLDELFRITPTVTLGIAPEAIYINNTRLDQEDPVTREFARFFSSLGVASISLHQGLGAQELIRFHQLLHERTDALEKDGNFDLLLQENQVAHISARMVDYSAFQAGAGGGTADSRQLWESFLYGLQNGILDFGDNEDNVDAVVELLNRKLLGSSSDQEESRRGIGLFLERSTRQQPQNTTHRDNRQLNLLLEKLSPNARDAFFKSSLDALEQQDHTAAHMLLQRISPAFLEGILSQANRTDRILPPRLLGLIRNLGTGAGGGKLAATRHALPNDVVRARLDVLFQEEQPDLYMPANYQQALHSVFLDDQRIDTPQEQQQELLEILGQQSVEQQCAEIIFELLLSRPEPEQVPAIQKNLLELSLFFLDAGDYSSLSRIYQHWRDYLYSDQACIDIFDEALIANHTQLSFMTDVLDGIDTWGMEKRQEIIDHVILVGEPYCELIVERLGLAPQYAERQLWIGVLSRIVTDAQRVILPFLKDERWYLVRNLITILGTDMNPASIKAIQPLCDHPHPQVRMEAIRALYPCSPATANRRLLKEIQSTDTAARDAAIRIADISHNPEILAILHRYLEPEPVTDTDLEFQRNVVATLCRHGNKESLVILRRILNRGGLLLGRRLRQLQEEIIAQLAEFPDPAADRLLHEFAGGKFRHQVTAVLKQRQRGKQ